MLAAMLVKPSSQSSIRTQSGLANSEFTLHSHCAGHKRTFHLQPILQTGTACSVPQLLSYAFLEEGMYLWSKQQGPWLMSFLVLCKARVKYVFVFVRKFLESEQLGVQEPIQGELILSYITLSNHMIPIVQKCWTSVEPCRTQKNWQNKSQVWCKHPNTLKTCEYTRKQFKCKDQVGAALN